MRLVLVACLVAGCGAQIGRQNGADLDVSGMFDLHGVPPGSDLAGLGQDMAASCDNTTNPCPGTRICFGGQCIADNGSCTTDDQCQNDTYCVCTGGGGADMGACLGGVCVPYGGNGPRGLFDPDCHSSAFNVGAFQPPMLHCKWTGTSGSNLVTMTPVVVDLDGDGTPEIVFGPMDSSYSQRLVALKSSDCSVLFDKPAALQGYSQYAAGDLDGDKVPELVGVGNDKKVRVFDNKGNLLATSPTAYSFSSGGGFDCSGPAIANVDGTGNPEIVIAGQVLRYTKGQTALTVLWTQPVVAAYWGTLDAVADLDGDGLAEVITGTTVRDGLTGADKTPSNLKTLLTYGAYPQVADFNGDGKPDLLLVQSQPGSQKALVFDYANNKTIFGPYTVASGGWGGPAVVADFDGDKIPDFGLASSTSYYVYSLKCAKSPKPADCKGTDLGVLWQKATQDGSSGGTASSVFDFNGDGTAEVVYRDECFLRVYNGPDGKTLFATPVQSGTAIELPVIADIDNDGHADIVVSADNIQGSSACPSTDPDTGTAWTSNTGLFVFRDPMNRWMPSRAIWNQSTYHITNINDDTSIPLTETPNWTSHNNYRQNVQGAASGTSLPQVDYTSTISIAIDNGGNECSKSERLWAQICDRGTAVAPAGISGAFYTADPRMSGAMLICTTKTTKPLNPGECEAVWCDWLMPPSNPQDLWFRSDDDGVKAPMGECKNGNNLLYLPGTQCYIPG